MSSLKVKVCGITREKDAKTAIKYGADLLGFIFYKKSPRSITVTQAKKIIQNMLPTISRVGVFVNENRDKILKIAQTLSLDFVQLCGNESKADMKFLSSHGFKIIKTIAVSTQLDLKKRLDVDVDVIHLDCADKNIYGGTGKQFNWDIKIPKSVKNIMLAGGINICNVANGIDKFNPLIIDVNSGVETKPGIKSDRLLKEFFVKVNKIRYDK